MAPRLCSKCLPATIEFTCTDCGNEFPVEVDSDAAIRVDGDVVSCLQRVTCPGCGEGNVLETADAESVEGVDR